jgi:hypothetical protein
MVSIIVVQCLAFTSGCVSVIPYGHFHWEAYTVGDGLGVNCSIRLHVESHLGDEKWKMEVREIARRTVLDGLHAQGIQVDDCATLSASEARRGIVFGLAAGSGDYVKRAVDMDVGFLMKFNDQLKNNAKVISSGSGTIPGL